MKSGGKKFRKRPFQLPVDGTPLSGTLRQIGDLIQKRDFAAGLSKANQTLAIPGMTKHNQSRVLALVGDSEFKRGRFAEGAKIQLQAASKNMDHAALWLRPHIGLVRALLKVPQVDQALLMARQTITIAETKMADFNEQVRLANLGLVETGSVAIPLVPPRVSVVATRVGYLFLQEGEPEAAEEFFNHATQVSKGGANRARQGLARVALAKGEFREALILSADVIRLGGYKAKTLPAWSTLIAARRNLGGWKISEHLIQGLDVAPARLRARTILTIVRELRKNDMRQWRDVAEEWSNREGRDFPIIEAEIRKLMLASAKLEPGNSADKREKAEQLLQMPGLSPREWLTGAKEWVRASLWEGRTVQIKRLLATAQSQYGPDFFCQARHGLALSCIMAKRHDLARPLLQANIQELDVGSPQWGKSIWALAKMEGHLDNHTAAAGLYRQIFEENSIPLPFRLQAQLRWADALVAAGQPDALLDALPLMASTLGTIKDPGLLMNFARQLATVSPEMDGWSRELFNKGAALALQQFQEASHPSVAISILFRLTRRQVCDFDRATDAIQLWEGMDDEKKDWLWSTQSNYWEYLGLLVRAYCMERRFDEAETFAKQWLQDPATPPVGVVHVGIQYARWLLNSRRVKEALLLFDRLTVETPTHALCALAWYWKALEAYKKQDLAERNRCVTCLRLAAGVQGSLQQEKELCAKATLLMADLDVDQVDAQAVGLPIDLFPTLRLHILQDLKRLP